MQTKIYFNEDFSNAVFSCNGTGILNIDLNNTNLGDTNHDEDDPDTIIRLLAGHIKFEKSKTLKEIVKWEINANSMASQ